MLIIFLCRILKFWNHVSYFFLDFSVRLCINYKQLSYFLYKQITFVSVRFLSVLTKFRQTRKEIGQRKDCKLVYFYYFLFFHENRVQNSRGEQSSWIPFLEINAQSNFIIHFFFFFFYKWRPICYEKFKHFYECMRC